MPAQAPSRATRTTAAVFPQNSFLENLAIRADGSILVTEILHSLAGLIWRVDLPAAGTAS